MLNEDPGKVGFGDVGGLGDQVRILREVKNKVFKRQLNCRLRILSFLKEWG